MGAPPKAWGLSGALDTTTRHIGELVMTTEQRNSDLASNLVVGLRDLANFIAANPDLAEGFRYELTSAGVNVHLQHAQDDKATEQGRYAQAAARHGAKVDKVVDDQWHNLTLTFAGGVKIDVLAYRSEVCERVVTATQTVTKSVPDPVALAQVPTVEVEETVETVEWVCRPLLGDKAAS